MADKRFLKQHDEATISAFMAEDGRHYRATRTDMDPIIDRVKYLNEKVNEAPRSGNRNGYHYIGSVPRTFIDDWLRKHNYTWAEFAVNAGGEKGKTDVNGPGVKDQFMKYYLSRDFAKLHTGHVTSKASDTGMIYTGGK